MLQRARRVLGVEGEDDLVALGVKEELLELRRVRVTLGEQDQKTRARLPLIRGAEVAAALEPLPEQAVGLSWL